MSTGRRAELIAPDGRALPLALGARLEAGRDPACALALPAPAAARHLAIEHRLAGVVVECLAGPAWEVTGEAAPLAPGQRRALAAGGLELRLAGLRLQVRIVAGAAPEGPPALPGLALERRLGAGASGEVWAGRLLRSGEPVAVKLIELGEDSLAGPRARREARLAERLRHPGIARILDLFPAEGRLVLVRELVPGPTLAELLTTRGRLPWAAAARLGIEAAGALAHAHAQGVVHRDVKPANLVLDAQGRPRLIDFDLAGGLDAALALTRLTASGEGLGSLGYLAPEQLDGAHEVDARADVYGLGATLLHALSGQAPHAAVEPEALLAAIRRGPRPLRALAPDLPPVLGEVIDRACAPDPARRWPDMTALTAALGEALPA